MDSGKLEHTAVVIMVHGTLEYGRNDLHGSPLKLLPRTCQTVQLGMRAHTDLDRCRAEGLAAEQMTGN